MGLSYRIVLFLPSSVIKLHVYAFICFFVRGFVCHWDYHLFTKQLKSNIVVATTLCRLLLMHVDVGEAGFANTCIAYDYCFEWLIVGDTFYNITSRIICRVVGCT